MWHAGSGSTNGAAIALGVLLGVVSCLLFVTLFLLVRDRRRRRESAESDSETGTQVWADMITIVSTACSCQYTCSLSRSGNKLQTMLLAALGDCIKLPSSLLLLCRLTSVPTAMQSGNTSNSSGLYLLWGSLRGNSRFWRGPRSRSSCRTQRSVDPRDFGVPDGPVSALQIACCGRQAKPLACLLELLDMSCLAMVITKGQASFYPSGYL